MPDLPITDGNGNLLPGQDVIDIISCAALWPNDIEAGRSLIKRVRAGEKEAARNLKLWHGQKLWTTSGSGKRKGGVPGGVGLAGAVLYNVLRLTQHLPDHASLNRTFHLMATAPPTWYAVGLKEAPSVDIIKQNWRKYKNASHISYALYSYMYEKYYAPDKEPVRQLTRPQVKNILARAEVLLEAGENVQLPRSPKNQTILDPTKTWKVPTDVKLPRVVVWLSDFSEVELRILRSYKSGQTQPKPK